MRTTVSLPDPILENIRGYAEARGVSFSTVVHEALLLLLSATESVPAPPVRLPTVKGRLVDPNMNVTKLTALADEEDDERILRKR